MKFRYSDDNGKFEKFKTKEMFQDQMDDLKYQPERLNETDQIVVSDATIDMRKSEHCE